MKSKHLSDCKSHQKKEMIYINGLMDIKEFMPIKDGKKWSEESRNKIIN